MPENEKMKVYRVFFFSLIFYTEVLISQSKTFPIFFIRELSLPTGASLFSVGRLNDDRFKDLVVASQRSITCIENSGSSFNFYFSIPVRENPSDVKLDDIDNDAVPEVLAVYRAKSEVEIYKKDTIGFNKFASLETGIYPDVLVLSDIDLNGIKDIVTVGKIMLGVAINYQIRPNYFSQPYNFFSQVPLRKVQILDLNYDEVPDLVGIDWLNNLLVISYGRGDGKFGSSYNYKLPEEPNDLTVADLNGDGLFDYIVSFYYLNEVQFYYTTQAGISPRFKFKVQKPIKLSSGDFNGDRLIDVVAGNGEKLFVFMNSLTKFDKYEFLSDGNTQLECVDLDANEKDDILVLDSAKSILRIFYSDAKAQTLEEFWLSVGLNSSNLSVADFNRDGYIDFAVVGDSLAFLLVYSKGDSFSIIQNQIHSSFTNVKFFSYSNYNYLLGSNYEFGEVSLFRFGLRERPTEIFRYNFDKPKPVFIGLSEDKAISIFLTISDSNLILIKPQGYFEFKEITIKDLDSSRVIAFTIGDFNNDALFDVAVVSRDNDNVRLSVFTKRKEGRYSRVYSTSLSNLISRSFLYADDFNNDGYQDILIYYDYLPAKTSGGEINIFFNDGTSRFRQRNKIDTHVHLGDRDLLKISDFSGDYRKDFAVFDKTRKKLYLYLNQEDGFKKVQIYSSRHDEINAIAVADVNYDGYIDLILLNGTNGGLGFLINKGGEFK